MLFSYLASSILFQSSSVIQDATIPDSVGGIDYWYF
jgi:hypothetical protein